MKDKALDIKVDYVENDRTSKKTPIITDEESVFNGSTISEV